MSQRTRRVGERGQVTIPKWLREEFGIEGGDEVRIESDEGKITIRKVPVDEELEDASRAAQRLSRNAIANQYGEDWYARNPGWDEDLPDLGENA
jgi:AbrB family looped-hinge helix DNA binding protein